MRVPPLRAIFFIAPPPQRDKLVYTYIEADFGRGSTGLLRALFEDAGAWRRARPPLPARYARP